MIVVLQLESPKNTVNLLFNYSSYALNYAKYPSSYSPPTPDFLLDLHQSFQHKKDIAAVILDASFIRHLTFRPQALRFLSEIL